MCVCVCAGAAGELVESDDHLLVRPAEGRRGARVPRDDSHERHGAQNQVLFGARRPAAPSTFAVNSFPFRFQTLTITFMTT